MTIIRTRKPGDVIYLVASGTCGESHERRLDAAKLTALQTSAYRKGPCYVVEETIAPDGNPRVTAPSPGGDWNGQCSSSFWVDDPDLTLIVEQGRLSPISNSAVRTTQVWHRRAVRGDNDAPLGGFRVVCQQSPNHDGDCCVPTPAGSIKWQWLDNVLFTIQAAWEVEGVR